MAFDPADSQAAEQGAGAMSAHGRDGHVAGGRSALRLVVAALVTVMAILLAAGFWLVAQARYLEDYCQTRAPQPKPLTPEGISGRPAYLDGPVTVRCDYDALPDIAVTDALPAFGGLMLALLVMAVALMAFRWTCRPRVR